MSIRWEFFHIVYMYQIITKYTLNILQLCQVYLNKTEKKIFEHNIKLLLVYSWF